VTPSGYRVPVSQASHGLASLSTEDREALARGAGILDRVLARR
jgi:hypothetical protein